MLRLSSKRRLAIAPKLASRYEHGVRFIDLAPLADSQLVSTAFLVLATEAMMKSVAYEARRAIPVHEERLKDAFPSRITRHSLRVTEICLADGEVSKVA